MNVFQEKVFVVIGSKVYTAGLYTNQLIVPKLNAGKGIPKAEIHSHESSFNSIFRGNASIFCAGNSVIHQAISLIEKSLQIVLVRDVELKHFGKAFTMHFPEYPFSDSHR
ncbi:hypothetical protein MLD38_035129 [Melastoma candidum]|uniref:Uncharacterized protein n=1 Tax=Melastoma candidum TaxID=119954 RepID=A0ACB9MCJ3_9MYRT|nr:hypothetical protein MLD38_035129 [Melastoma candidum]